MRRAESHGIGDLRPGQSGAARDEQQSGFDSFDLLAGRRQQSQSFLGLSGAEAIGHAITDCLSSADSERVRSYRDRFADPASSHAPGIAVIVQTLVGAEAAGVMFTPADVGGSTRIEAAWGPGVDIVGGTADFATMRTGEILVCTYTTPAWTPLFRVAGGIITETGGVLSRAAIVAREFGIPAATGLTDATTRLSTGRRITLDGSTGTVTVHP